MNKIEKATMTVQELERKLLQNEAEAAAIIQQLETARNEVKEVSKQREAIEKIDRHLATAKQALIDASEVARSAEIDFTFVTPNGEEQTFNARWQSSDCYGSNGWYNTDTGYGYQRDWAASGTAC